MLNILFICVTTIICVGSWNLATLKQSVSLLWNQTLTTFVVLVAGNMSLPVLDYDEDILNSDEAKSFLEEEARSILEAPENVLSANSPRHDGSASPVFSITEAVSNLDRSRQSRSSPRKLATQPQPTQENNTESDSKLLLRYILTRTDFFLNWFGTRLMSQIWILFFIKYLSQHGIILWNHF